MDPNFSVSSAAPSALRGWDPAPSGVSPSVRPRALAAREPGEYRRALERSPGLQARLESASRQRLDLREEAALARAFLQEALALLAAAHARSGQLSAEAFSLVSTLLGEVTSIVDRAASLELKTASVGLDAAKLVALLALLRDDLVGSLRRGGFDRACSLVDATFERAKWTGDLTDAQVQAALAAPISYDVKFRPIVRGSNGQPVEADDAAVEANPLAALRDDPLAAPRARAAELDAELLGGSVAARARGLAELPPASALAAAEVEAPEENGEPAVEDGGEGGER